MSGIEPQDQLKELESKQLIRRLRQVEPAPHGRVKMEGRALWNFSSNDYLGLSNHPDIKAAFIGGVEKYGAGSAASRLVTGTTGPHLELENLISRSKSTEAALTFSSGFATALSCIPTIVGKGDFVFLDKLSHACLIDAAKSSQATLRVFPHNNAEALDTLLQKVRSKHTSRILVVTESIFSMDGDLCPLEKILNCCEKHGADLFLDEAHAVGIFGKTGMGLAEELGVQDRIAFQMGTLSKAIGLSGGYLAASRDWIDLFINRARPFIYTTAPPPAIAHAAKAAFDLISSSEGTLLRQKLHRHIKIFDPKLQSAICPWIIGSNQGALDASKSLEKEGFLVSAIRYPTVPKNTARLRITFTTDQSEDAVRSLKKILNNQSLRS